jgi:TolB protein
MPRPRLRRFCGLLLSCVVVLFLPTGCIQPIRPLTPTPPVALADASTNRLLILGPDGNLFTVAPDGGTRLSLTTDATNDHFYVQPTWSPTGERIAWGEINSAASDLSGALLTAAADGSDQTRAELLFPPFYLSWSPNGEQVAYLSNWLSDSGPTIALQLVEMATGSEESQLLGQGQPFYFSWSPDSSQLLTHIGNQRVGLLALDGSEALLAEAPARFAAPQWSSDGQRLLYGITQAGAPQLILAAPDGTVQQVVTLLQAGARVAFRLSASGNYVAYTETSVSVAVNSFGPLFLFDRAGETYEQLSADPVLAFFWSPAGDQLLFFSAEFEEERPWLRLNVWDGDEIRTYGRMIPTALFLSQYLPFADQYAQNMQFWSPDGSAFVYTGLREDGQRGVWVQRLEAETPDFVADGLVATWSPR